MSSDKRVVITKTPFRLSFAGGGTDIPEYYKRFGTGAVVSGALNKYVFTGAHQYFFEDKIRIHYARTENDIDNVNDIQHPSIRECLKLMKIKSGIQISSVADIPSKGTGLGSSSSFAVGLLNALHNWKGNKSDSAKLAEEAVYIERTALKEPGGKQDQYVAAFGGLLFMEFFKDDSVKIRRIKIKKGELRDLEKHLLLMYTGRERDAGTLEAKKVSGFASHAEALRRMADLARMQFEAFEDGRWMETGRLLHENWQLKRTLADGVSSDYIDRFYKTALENGAEGGKLMGAGGSGFLLFFADPDKHERIIDSLPELRPEPFALEPEGSKVIYSQGEPIR